jgi:lipopolysaccharide/colanic/teichoic acid biosynthesis glycosyltransferase
VTGWWQVLGRNDIPFRELLVRTIPVVLSRRGSN